MAGEPAIPRKRSLVQTAPLKRGLSGLVRGLSGSIKGRRSSAAKDKREPSPAPSVGTSASTRSDVSDFSHLSEDSFDQEQVVLPFFEDEAMHVRWEALLGGGLEPWQLPSEELRALIVRGMPMKHRLALWPRWCTLPPGSIESVEELQGLASATASAQIDLDVPRAHPHWPLSVAQRDVLRRVLRACAARRPEVGYCQGMGHMAAMFVVLGFDEDTALRGLCSLLESHMEGYHDEALSGWLRDARLLERLATRALSPEAMQRIRALEVPLEVLASDHFLTLGSRAWPLEAALRLWDLVLLDGPAALFSSFLSVLDAFLPSEEEVALLDSMYLEAPEPVELFRERMQQGLAEAPEKTLQRTVDIMESLSASVLDELRQTL